MTARPSRPLPAGGRLARSLVLCGLMASGAALAQAPDCKLLTDEHGLRALPGCEVVGHTLKISAAALKDLDYDDHGLAVVYADQGFHYVDRTGRSLPVLTWDNGPDTPQEGLLRGRVGDRVGYFDLQFRQVVPALFDFAWPFKDGVAEVCNGCRRGTPDGDGHTPMEGGEWFRIDRSGRRVK
ncbi:WG repeat-containing protein [Stenotrophomonas maltophilia]|uniref:WG repeat-containing protein n=1 Tax=Stenotrophomonas maltophilia TaxID=40324 RepID=UPI0009A1875B|nr:WG repeat-containing protein [Stenotrophomonas maltophilia]